MAVGIEESQHVNGRAADGDWLKICIVIARAEPDGTLAENRFRLSPKWRGSI